MKDCLGDHGECAYHNACLYQCGRKEAMTAPKPLVSDEELRTFIRRELFMTKVMKYLAGGFVAGLVIACLATAAIFALSGCGGGGDSYSAQAPTPPVKNTEVRLQDVKE